MRARGSGIWDRASRRVMPLPCPTSRISVKSGGLDQEAFYAFYPGHLALLAAVKALLA